jgi:hypothetical protein
VELQRILESVFAGEDCHAASATEVQLRSRLSAAGLIYWHVERRTGIRDDDCVTDLTIARTATIRLLPALRPSVRTALDGLWTDLMNECLDKEAATDRVTVTLSRLGETDFVVRTDGPVSAPRERIDDAVAHVKQGCFTYSGVGWSEDGQAIVYLAGSR